MRTAYLRTSLYAFLSVASLASTITLSACGGGGAAAATSTTPVIPVTPIVVTTPTTPNPPALPSGGQPADWKLVWADEFDKSGLPDSSKWDYDTAANKVGWFNHELQYYSRERVENSTIADGKLTITALKEKLTSASDFGGQAYTSARLLTRGKASWTYGYFEIRAKLPCGFGTWPAIWMLGTKGAWPDDGEIDIMEHVGKKKGEILGSAYTNFYNWAKGTGNTKTTLVPDVCDAFHNYQLYWDKEQLAIGVDGKYYFQFVNPKTGDYQKWPFDQPQYLILNLAIGGDLGGAVDDSIFPSKFEIDYVRVYQK
jgi:beta-glucanase (GH16 family)